jgi:hypothetical protein
MNYYNEHDPFAAQWLRNLIAGGMIPAGDVDARDIQEVTADDLRGPIQALREGSASDQSGRDMWGKAPILFRAICSFCGYATPRFARGLACALNLRPCFLRTIRNSSAQWGYTSEIELDYCQVIVLPWFFLCKLGRVRDCGDAILLLFLPLLPAGIHRNKSIFGFGLA